MTDDERQAKISEFADARDKMTDKERQAEIAGIRKELGILPRKTPGADEGPYEADTTNQAAATTPKDTINIDSGDDNDNDDEDEEDDKTLHPRTVRK